MSELTGQTVAGYPIQKLLSKAAYREMYQAETSGAPLAVKILRPDLRSDAHFNSSIVKGWEAVRPVMHPNLVTVFGTGTDPALGAYSLEELVAGKVLRQMILEGAKVAWRDCLIIAEQLFGAIKALHDAKHVHGEIWPANVMMTQDQDLKLEGAGGLTHLNTPLDELFQGPGLGYQAPERLEGSPLSVEADLYSAGACLYFVLAGQDPFPGEDVEVVSKAVRERKPAPLSVLREDIPHEAEDFIGRLMAKDPTQRYGSVNDVIADVAKLKSGKPMGPLKGGKAAAPPRLKRPAPRPPASHPPSSHMQAATPGTGVPPVSAKRTGLLAAVKGGSSGGGGPGTRVVFGRLETHVKSTIPQSEIEKRGDDFYRQGQLPLALNTWRDAFANATPHAALKVKIELAEKELKKEAYAVAMEEARHRLLIGDGKGAIDRAREATLAAETDQQRQDALRLENEAIEKTREAAKQGNIKLIAGVAGFLFVIYLLSKLFGGGGSSADPYEGHDGPGTGETVVVKPETGNVAQKGIFLVTGGHATVKYPENWIAEGSELRVPLPNGSPAVFMRVAKLPDGTPHQQKRQELLDTSKMTEPSILDNIEIFTMLNGQYQVSEIGIRYMDADKAQVRYVYTIAGPSDSLYQAEFRGTEEAFDYQLRNQMRTIIQSWTFKEK